MVKHKKFMIILMVFLVGTVLLIGCTAGKSEETGQGNTDLSGSQEIETTATVGGTLKAVDSDAGTVTIATENDGELELKVNDQTEIKIGESPASLVQLADEIDNGIRVEYDAETKILMSANIEKENTCLSGSQEAETRTTVTVTGTLKAVDSAAGTVTIATESGELELKVNDQSEINIGQSLASLVQSADKADTKVRAEYDAETKILKAFSLED